MVENKISYSEWINTHEALTTMVSFLKNIFHLIGLL